MIPMVIMMRDYIENLFGIPSLLAGNDEGQGMVEYVMIVGTISLVIVAAFITTNIGTAITGLANKIATDIAG